MNNFVSVEFENFTYPDYDVEKSFATYFFQNTEMNSMEDWEIEEEIESMILSPDNYDNQISRIASDNYGRIKNWKITFIGDIVELNDFTNFKDTNVTLFVEMPMFTGINLGDYDKLYELYSSRFNKQHPNLDFDTIMQNTSDFKIEKSEAKTGIIVSFLFDYEIFIYLYNQKFDFKLVYHEIANDIFNITDNKKVQLEDININGNIAFLEGSYHLDTSYSELIDILNNKNNSYITLTDLYKEPEKLALLKKYEINTIVFKTTGFNSELDNIINVFKSLNYSPENIIILGENVLGKDVSKYGLTSSLFFIK